MPAGSLRGGKDTTGIPGSSAGRGEGRQAAGFQGLDPEPQTSHVWEQVANLVEAPVPLLGRFEPKFLDLPKEVLVTVMRKQQRYFPVEEEGSGKLLPCFVAVPNGHLDVAAVRKGNEAVLRSTFNSYILTP